MDHRATGASVRELDVDGSFLFFNFFENHVDGSGVVRRFILLGRYRWNWLAVCSSRLGFGCGTFHGRSYG